MHIDGIKDPAVLLDGNNRIKKANQAWKELFAVAGDQEASLEARFPWLNAELEILKACDETESTFTKHLPTSKGMKYLIVNIKNIFIPGQGFDGAAVILKDLTDYI